MEPEEEKKLNDDLIGFVRKRSETEAPRYVTKLKRLADVHAKKRRAALARKRTEHAVTENIDIKKSECAVCGKAKISDQTPGENDSRKMIRRGGEQGVRSGSRSRSEEPVDRCRRRRRRRSCGRKRRRRRRRSCCCRRRRRRRRRSCSRRRRRRSCRRRRRKCRRRR